MYRYHLVAEMLSTFETFKVKEVCTFKHEPFFIVGGGGGGLFVVLYGINERKLYLSYCLPHTHAPNPLP